MDFCRISVIDFAKNRERIRQQIQQRLTHDLLPVGIRINTISLRNVDLTPALKEAIEQTAEAEQQAKRAQAQVAIKEAEANQAIAEAAGQAQAGIERAQGEATANIPGRVARRQRFPHLSPEERKLPWTLADLRELARMYEEHRRDQLAP